MLLFYQISAWVFLIHMFLYAGFYCIGLSIVPNDPMLVQYQKINLTCMKTPLILCICLVCKTMLGSSSQSPILFKYPFGFRLISISIIAIFLSHVINLSLFKFAQNPVCSVQTSLWSVHKSSGQCFTNVLGKQDILCYVQQ